MNTGSTSTLSASAKYDDQGLYFSLFLGACLTLLFCPFVLYLSSTSTLWLKRLYRPNHTVEPPAATTSTGPGGASRNAGNYHSYSNSAGSLSGTSGPPSPRSPRSPRSPFDEAGTPSAAAPVVRSNHGRRKRLGISLPYVSSFYQLPSWRDWWSVEEVVPHLETALAECGSSSSSSSRTAGDSAAGATHSPVKDATGAPQSCGPAAAAAWTGLGSDSFVSPASIDFRQASGTRMLAPLTYGPSAGVAGLVSSPSRQGLAGQDEHTPLSRRERGVVDAGRWPSEAEAARVRMGYGTVHSPSDADRVTHNNTNNNKNGAGLASGLPRTPLDPQVALYIYTLKYFITFLVIGCCFVSWICWVASTDDAVEWMLLRNDPHRCNKQGTNETGCVLLQPYCTFLGSDIGCTPVPLPGLYDFTVKNIRPRSDLWWWVGLLNIGFVASFIVITLYFVQAADVYITKVMRMQMGRAMGYRVACVCGLGEQRKSTRRKFEKLYLSAEAYFPSAAAATVTATITVNGEPGGRSPAADGASPTASATRRARSMTEAFQETVYRRLSCPGMSCLFSIARVHLYETTVEQLVFAKPGRVKAILFTRRAPEDMYPTIGAAENAISDLQEAIAQQNALTRQRRYHQRARTLASPRRVPLNQVEEDGYVVVASPTSPSSARPWHPDAAAVGSGGSGASTGPVLYQYVGCCHKVSAVPYREDEFRKWGAHLDALLEQVPKQPVAGAVFVEFKNSRSAFEFVNVFEARFGGVSSRANALIAGPPGHIIESNLDVDKFILAIRFILLLGFYFLLLMTWSIPVGFLGSLDNLALIGGPAFRDWLYTDVPAWLRALAIAYLPVIALALFNVILPFLIRFIVIAMGAVTKAECDGGHLYLQYMFMVLTAVVFQAALQGGLAEAPNLIGTMGTEQIIDLLVSCVTPQSGYWYAKVITSTALSAWLDLVDPIALLRAILFRNRARVQRRYDAIFRPIEFQYPRQYSFDIMILSIAVLFHMTAPLLVPFVALYFIVRYLTQRAKLYDRYRPSFPASDDCTDFGVSAQVMRAVITLLCFAEMCGLFVMSLKKHTGGMIMCSFTLSASLVLAVYIYVQTRTWVSTLGNARRFFPEDAYTPATTTTATAPTGAAGSGAGGDEPVESALDEDARCDSDSNGSSLRTFSDVESPRTSSPPCGTDGGWPRNGAGAGAIASTDSVAVALAAAATATTTRTTTDTTDAITRSSTRRWHTHALATNAQLLRDDEAMDGYEHLRVLHSISDRSTNPYVGHLLPRKPGLRHLYQPKHQRLAIMDLDKEVSAMMETEFVVERYWDRGMTWFEADADDQADTTARALMGASPRTEERPRGDRARSAMPPPQASPSSSSSLSVRTPVAVTPRNTQPGAPRMSSECERASVEDAELPVVTDTEKKEEASSDEL